MREGRCAHKLYCCGQSLGLKWILWRFARIHRLKSVANTMTAEDRNQFSAKKRVVIGFFKG